ncbi:MAG: GAF domain-containing protein [Elusimicrobiota bacterium]|nr:GAF domain-containing protein [Elusimicrobiota bacterium]
MSDHYLKCQSAINEFLAKKFQNEEEIWDFFIRQSSSFVGSIVATFFETDEKKRTLSIKNSIGPVGEDIKGVSFGYEGIVGWCADSKKSIIVNDVETDNRFSKKMDFSSGFKTKNILAVPCMADNELLGILEFMNSLNGEFSETDLALAEIMASFVSQKVYIAKLKGTINKLNLKGESTINNLSGGFIGVDLNGKIIFFNPKAKEIFEVGDEYMDKNIMDLMQLCPDVVNVIGAVLKEDKVVRRQDFKCNVNGKDKIIGYSSMNIKGVEGENTGAGMIFQDITHL